MRIQLLIACLLLSVFFKSLNAQFYSKDSKEWNKSVKQDELKKPKANESISQDLSQALQNVLYQQADEMEMVGLAASIIFTDGSVWNGATGINSSNQDSLNTNLTFGIGSVTKSLTAACILKMQEDGVLSLEDPLSDWLPPYDNINPDITIKQLLNHTSGIYNYSDNGMLTIAIYMDNTKIWQAEEIITDYILEPVFAPGTAWDYCNTNYLLLGMIIESASSNSYEDEVRNRVLNPLGLTSFSLFPQEESSLPRAHLWGDIYNTGNFIDMDAAGISMNGLYSPAFSAGAYLASPTETSLWIKKLFTSNFLSASSLQQLKTWVEKGEPGEYYGLGVEKFNYQGAEFMGHKGVIGHRTYSSYIPSKDLTITVVTNDAMQENLIAVLHALYDTYMEYASVIDYVNIDQSLTVFPTCFHNDFTIQFELSKASEVQFSIVDMQGREVFKSAKKSYSKGEQKWYINETSICSSSSILFLKLRSDEGSSVVKLVHY